MYFRFANTFAYSLSVSILLSACSVKEDRLPCPCILTIDLENLRGEHQLEMETATVAYLCNGDGCFLPEEVPPEMEVETTKSGISVYFHSLSSAWGRFSHGDSLIIHTGQECPPIYSYSKSLDTNCEVLRDTVLMHKNFSRIRIVAPAFEGIADSFCVTGNVKGYSLQGDPLIGSFSCSRVPDADNSVTIAVPRQVDSSLKFLVMTNAQTFRSFAIGQAIMSSGYDWNAVALPDITIELDYAATKISYSTDLWSETQIFTVVL